MRNWGYIQNDNLLRPNMKNQIMAEDEKWLKNPKMTNQTTAEEAVELFIVVIVVTVIVCLFSGICHMIYVAYCRRCCRQHSSEDTSEESQALSRVTEEDLEMLSIISDSNIN